MVDLRRKFLDYFASKNHTIEPSAPLVPEDPTLLFNSAGMVPFKDYFLGTATGLSRAASCQLCLRTTDIERVGSTKRHLTFFEMLGNFSFGDYFKNEAIEWAWEFLTQEAGISEKNLWASVYKDDHEAKEIWRRYLPESKIIPLGDDSNFWTMGPTGPCGPCAEIYWDFGADQGCPSPCLPGCDNCERYLEIWNLVFTQFDRQTDGKLKPLARKNIDTGMGLERIVSIVENRDTLSTSLFEPLGSATEDLLKIRRQDHVRAVRILADHARSSWFLLAHGIFPSNVGRGYVLRRLIRRAAKEARMLGSRGPFLSLLGDAVREVFKNDYPNICERFAAVRSILADEEARFEQTLETGLDFLKEEISQIKTSGRRIFSGRSAFRLYDTYGFPVEMIDEVLRQEKFSLDTGAFDAEREKAREISRQSWRGSGDQKTVNYSDISRRLKISPSVFTGYENLESRAKVVAIVDREGIPVVSAKTGEDVDIILDQTPFYAQGGGQQGDSGRLIWPSGEAAVIDTISPQEGLIVHKSKILFGTIGQDEDVGARVDQQRRRQTSRHHSATHLTHWALRKILGTQVAQAGSQVTSDKLRLDFTYPSSIKGKILNDVEGLVQEAIASNISRERRVLSLAEARSQGAMTLFNEKYGEKVYVVRFGEAYEACGGTHVENTAEINGFKIIKESSVAAGVRRVEAVAGVAYLKWQEGQSSQGAVAAGKRVAPQMTAGEVAWQVKEGVTSRKIPYRLKTCVGATIDILRGVVDRERREFKGIILAVSRQNGKSSFVLGIHPALIAHGFSALALAQELTKKHGGGCGGRPDFCQGALETPISEDIDWL
ncbi:MAG: alanine--tRNA ligase [Elusimicrobia bacterium]|nr:alanine--tRNA ligase [Elusimicrobiota bacterium]